MKKTTLGTACFLSLFLAFYFVSCKKESPLQSQDAQGDPNLPSTPYDYLSKHGVNNDYATLGRVLFYDKNLSGNNNIACGSCHKQEFAFANNTKVDKGSNGLNLKRNSPSIQGFKGFSFFDVSYPTKDNQQDVLLFWDGRQRNLADMVLNPVLNHNEMNMPDFDQLVKKLSGISYYSQLFKNAFGNETITKERIAFALESFVSCLNTSKDNSSTIVIDPNISNGITPPSNIIEMGQFLFHNKYNCAQCHDQHPNNAPVSSGPYSSPTEPSVAMFNIGLDVNYSDKGLGQLTGLPGDNGLFKVPTLQNISVTAPYMHDGRFSTLGEVLDHYSHNIQPNGNLSPLFKNPDGTPKKLNILPAEKEALIAFLNTLKNEDFLSSPMYSDPFKK